MAWKITDVFTPRRPEVNEYMYISRRGLESALRDGLQSHFHILLSGDSGCGKSWLYKKVFKDLGIGYIIADCANGARFGALSEEFRTICERERPVTRTGYTEQKGAKIMVAVAEGGLEHTDEYIEHPSEPFEDVLSLLNRKNRSAQSVLVIDNLEKIVHDRERMKELGDLITLCDNPTYAKYNVKLLIVGVPKDVRRYFSQTLNQETVANRLLEIPEVGALTRDNTQVFVTLGFNRFLKYDLPPETLVDWGKTIYHYTMGIPQRLHELCFAVATTYIRDRRRIDVLDRAAMKWAGESMSQFRSNIEEAMNERHTKAGRRNQVLYALGKVQSETFNATEIEKIVRREFPNSTKGLTLDIGASLSHLSQLRNPILQSASRGKAYVFSDKRSQMCIRCVLKSENESVRLIDDEDVDLLL